MELKELIENFGEKAIVDAIGLDRVLEHYTNVDILSELDEDDIVVYLERHNYDFSQFVDINNDEDENGFTLDDFSDKELLYEICKRHTIKGFVDNNEMRTIINDIIDGFTQLTHIL